MLKLHFINLIPALTFILWYQIQDFEGVLQSGEMALILGRPGAGCTTFLKTMANLRDGVAGVDGHVIYGDMNAAEARAVRTFPTLKLVCIVKSRSNSSIV